jgi:enoyl-CoA hydratase/carnithine racemase
MGVINYTTNEHIATIEVCDPEKYNAVSLSMWIDIKKSIDKINADSQIRVCIMRGHGEKAFVSGANISEFETQRGSKDASEVYNAAVEAAQKAISNCKVPVIAAISGICYGGGLALALSCDMRYASPNSKFRMPAARLGLGYGYRNMQQFLANLGPIFTSEAFFSANVYSASQAEKMGVINTVQEDVFAYCQELASQIAGNAPLTVQAAKRAIRSIMQNDQTNIESISAQINACFDSKDYAEGRKAFAEKRTPNFKGE